MSVECVECEHDLRGGHAEGCSRYVWQPGVGEVVTHPEQGEGVVLYVDELLAVARVRYGGGLVVAWCPFSDLKPGGSGS